VDFGQHLGQFSGLSERLFLLQRVDVFDGRIEAHFASVVLDGLDADRGGDVAFAGAWSADQDDVFRIFHEFASVQLLDVGFVDFAGFEVEAREVLIGRKARHVCVIGN